MRPIKKKAIFQFDKEQRDTIRHGSLLLYVPDRAGINTDNRDGMPTIAKVVHGGSTDLKEGDLAVFVHTVLDDVAIRIFEDKSVVTVTIPCDGSETIYGIVGENGDLKPMFKNVIVKRIEEMGSSIIITPDAFKKHERNKGIVLCAAKDSKYIEGQTIIYHIHSDYDLSYTVNGADRRYTVVKDDDIVGVYE